MSGTHVTSIAPARNLRSRDVVVRLMTEREVLNVVAQPSDGSTLVTYRDGTSDTFGPGVTVVRRRPRKEPLTA